MEDGVTWRNAYTYLGNEDDGGLMYSHVRYYAKELGRFYLVSYGY